jgi:tetratricopeptide (TPR) repeat protein
MLINRLAPAGRKILTAAFCLFLVSTACAQSGEKQSDQQTREQLRGFVLQARDAVIRLAAEDPATLNTSISDKVAQLVDGMLYIDDRDDIRYLQQHLKKVYADEIKSVPVSVPATGDFPRLIAEAEHEKDSAKRDEKLRALVEQQIKQGLLDDAAINTAKIRVSTLRARLFGSVAMAQHKAASDSAAEQALEAAIHACLERRPGALAWSADMELDVLARSMGGQDYPEGARRVLAREASFLTSRKDSNGYQWAHVAITAVDTGNLDMAEQVLPKIDDDELRSAVDERIVAARARQEDPAGGIRLAIQINDPDRRADVLCDIARKQAEAGSGPAGVATIELALEAAAQSDQDRVFTLNNIAWAQIDIGDRAGAEKTVELALHENENNERHKYGSDQVDGWAVVADTVAFLGDFSRAHQIASKIDDPYFRGIALNFIAKREVEAGHWEEAVSWVGKLKDPDERVASYLGIIQAMIQKLKDASK